MCIPTYLLSNEIGAYFISGFYCCKHVTLRTYVCSKQQSEIKYEVRLGEGGGQDICLPVRSHYWELDILTPARSTQNSRALCLEYAIIVSFKLWKSVR